MTFLHPEFLYYMLVPLVILFWFLFTQKESHEHFFSEDIISRLRVNSNTLTQKARNALFLLMAFFMLIALAQPVIKEQKVEVKAKSADIMIAIDISDSMLASDIYPNRLEAAKQKVLTLLDEAPNERVGLIAFSKNSYLVSPLSFDLNAVAFLLRKLNTTSITEKGTDFLSLLEVVGKTQEKRDKKYLLILTDGGDKSDFLDEIEMAKKEGITVFVLATATKKGSPVKKEDGTFIKYKGDIIVSKLNENISDLATKTGGVYIQSTTSSKDIKAMLGEIDNITGKKELKSEEIEMHKPLFYYPLGAALLILLIATSSLKSKSSINMSVLFILSLYLFNPSTTQAAIFDFMKLKEAKDAYENKEYEKSAQIYKDYALESSNAKSYFNAANSYYKQEKYKEAIESYNKALLAEENRDEKAKIYSNLGNSYVKQAAKENLQKAVESYEKSLEIKDDKETRENLQEVKKFLEKRKQEQKKTQQESQDKEDKDKENDKNSDNKNSQNNKEEKSDKQRKKDEQKEQKDDSEAKNSKNKEKSQDDIKDKEDKSKSSSDNNHTDKDSKKRKAEELKEESKKDSNISSSKPQGLDKDTMSDAEQKKWLQQLNSNENTYLYRLNPQKPKENSPDEKPW